MIGSFLTRGLVMIFGYIYPAYDCFKILERNKPDIDQLRFWCQYWILVAMLTVFERVSDAFVSWVPMYSEAKLAFIIYLWYPRTKGTTFVYGSFFKPYVLKHENEIDRNLLELKSRAGDMAYMYCQKAASYGQTRIFEVLQYVAAQSTPRPRATEPQQQSTSTAKPAAVTSPTAAAAHQPVTKVQATIKPHDEEPLSPTSSTSSTQDHEMEDVSSAKEATTSVAAPPSPARTLVKKSVSMSHVPASIKTDKSPAKALPCTEETVMEETIRVTRGRLRKTMSTVTK